MTGGSEIADPGAGTPNTETFLFADLAGFTAMTEAHGDHLAADVVDEFCEATQRLLPEYGAEQVKTIGDAVMLRCREPVQGVALAVRLVDDIGARHGFPAVRVGGHTGPALRRGEDWIGATVNLAARVADAAEGGEVLITSATRAQLPEDPAGLSLCALGPRSFKNVGQPVELYAVVRHGERTAAGRAIDPVCRMALDFARTEHRTIHRGVEYYFCSEQCADAFATDPARHDVRRRSSRAALLVSDSAREHTVAQLQRAHRHGRLTTPDLESRAARAYTARTRGDLRALTHDLPRPRRVRMRRRMRGLMRVLTLPLRVVRRWFR